MFPASALAYATNMRMTDVEAASNDATGFRRRQNLLNLFSRQFVFPVTFSECALPLANRVVNIVSDRTKEKMGRIHTRWIVTTRAIVKHLQIIWNGVVHQFPHVSMRANLMSARFCEKPISVFIQRCGPYPASIGR